MKRTLVIASLSFAARSLGFVSPVSFRKNLQTQESFPTTTTSGTVDRGFGKNIGYNKNEFKALHVNLGNWEDVIYAAQSSASGLAASSMNFGNNGISLSSLGVLYFAGLLTSVSPCSLGLLPLTVSYISTAAGEREDKAALLPTIAFATGLASVFCGLGLSAALLGGVFGSNGGGNTAAGLVAALLSSGVCMLMGFQLLDLVSIPLPSIELDIPATERIQYDEDGNVLPDSTVQNEISENLSSFLRTFLLGGSSALVASPCATPVLTSILAFVAADRSPTLGATLLFTYSIGYSTPLLLVGATGGQLLAQISGSDDEGWVGKIGSWVTPITASILLWYGTTGMLTTLFGDPTLAGLAPILE